MILHFPSLGSFLGPLSTKDGKPIGPKRYKELVKEAYLISKHIHTSYYDILKMTPVEREYILEFIADEIAKSKEYIERRQKNKKQ